MHIFCLSLPVSGLTISDEDAFCDTLEDVVTSVKRNGVAMKGNSIDHLLSIKLLTNHYSLLTAVCYKCTCTFTYFLEVHIISTTKDGMSIDIIEKLVVTFI